VPEARTYYEKKRREGKDHHQAMRSLARYLVKIIWAMAKNDRPYIIKNGKVEELKEIKEEEKITKVA
jgi:50S ribosomal subunit-associated GTPase HflX